MSHTTILNEAGEVIGTQEFAEALEAGSIRAVSRVFIFNERGEVLLQKRTANVLFPHTELESAGGHVGPGETFRETAENELREELGIKTDLIEIAQNIRPTGEPCSGSVFKGTIDATQTEITFDPKEVAGVRWITPDRLDEEIVSNTENFTPGFPEVWQRLRAKLVAS